MTGPTERDPRGTGRPRLDRTAGVVGLVTYVMVGLLPLVTDIAMSSMWWVLWALGVPVFAVLVLVERRRELDLTALVAAAVLGAGLFALEPQYGFGAVPLVIVAACAGLLLSLRYAVLVVAAQTVVIVGVTAPGDVGFGALSVVFYVGLMLFAVITGQIARREVIAGDALTEVLGDLRRAHEDLRTAHAELEAAQARLAETSRDDERLRISRDLHDLVGHQLSALAVNLEVASHVVEGPGSEHVTQARALAKDLLGDVRDVVGRLREPATELRAALVDMAAAIPRPAVHLTLATGLGELAPITAEAVERCVQEILTNAVRHSAAAGVWVDVSREGGHVRVLAHDDGRGATQIRPGNGLTGMRERVTALGGSIEVDGGGGDSGFRVSLRVPAGSDA